MTPPQHRPRTAAAQRTLSEAVAAATGREERADPVLAGTGGPAGNARLTAWTGLVLLPLFLVELATLLALRQLLSWHIVVGVLLVPPALLKTLSTGWRVVRYYTRHPPYRQAGPPPLLLRVLGPLVVLSTLAVLGSGLALIALGPDATHAALVDVVGRRVDALTVHQACFLFWAAATGLHVLGRTVPAARVLAGSPWSRPAVQGEPSRLIALLLSLVAGAVAAALVLGASGGWTSQVFPRFDRGPGAGQDNGG